MPATTSTINELRDNLAVGLGIVSRRWDFRTMGWVTSVYIADVMKMANPKVFACTRDGRVFLLTAEKGEKRWEN